MTRAFDFEQLRQRWNQSDRAFHFLNRSERVARTVDEQDWGTQLGEMRGTQLLGFAWRMQRIGKQKEAIDKARRFGRQHTRLPAAVGMPTKPDLAMVLLAKL